VREQTQPTRARVVVSIVVTVVFLIAVWKLIDYRMQPPPPPQPAASAPQH
jgi:hypothetical protein